MKALAMKPPELARLEAAFCLDKLSARVQSDVLADGRLAARFLFEVKHPVRLADDLAFPRQELFVAFRSAADKGEFTLQAKSGAVGQVAISDDHVATVDFGGRRWRFMYVALLASEIDRRKQVLESLLARHTLSVGAQQHLLSIVRKDNLSDEEFLEMVALLDTSPENFAHGLSSHANEEKISRTDLLPRDDRYWDNLAPAPLSSGDLVHYLANELGEVRRIRFAAEPHRALDFASLGCAATFLAPLEATRKIESDILCSMIERATKHDDHFALLTLFEICVDSVGRDVSFEDLGERALERLFGDMARLKTSCEIFAAGFVIATAHLAEHELLRDRPAFWRRCAAATHASLIVRTCGVGPIGQEELVSWAFEQCGFQYFSSVVADMRVEPRWRPEWISANYLVADAWGRAKNAIDKLGGDRAPSKWTNRLGAAGRWIDEEGIRPAVMFPSILEGEPRPAPVNLSERAPLSDVFNQFFGDATFSRFLSMAHVVYSFGAPPEMVPSVKKILDIIRADPRDLSDPPMDAAVALASSIAVRLHDGGLAGAIAELCLEKASFTNDGLAVRKSVVRLLECSQADEDRERARSSLARWVESLAFRIPAEVSLDLAEMISILTRIMPELTPSLSRAAAAARLGAARLPAG